jgi:acyl-homoserine lactone acylase PvdQ
MWQETLNEAETHYFVDGEWRQLKILSEEIKVKGKDTLNFQVKQTHRGSLFDHALMEDATQLFGSPMPASNNKHKYSLAWGGNQAGDHFMDIWVPITTGKNVPEMI